MPESEIPWLRECGAAGRCIEALRSVFSVAQMTGYPVRNQSFSTVPADVPSGPFIHWPIRQRGLMNTKYLLAKKNRPTVDLDRVANGYPLGSL